MTQMIFRVIHADPEGAFDLEVADYGGDAVVSLAVLQDGDVDKPLARVELTPERARELASALMQAATSVDSQPSMVTAA